MKVLFTFALVLAVLAFTYAEDESIEADQSESSPGQPAEEPSVDLAEKHSHLPQLQYAKPARPPRPFGKPNNEEQKNGGGNSLNRKPVVFDIYINLGGGNNLLDEQNGDSNDDSNDNSDASGNDADNNGEDNNEADAAE